MAGAFAISCIGVGIISRSLLSLLSESFWVGSKGSLQMSMSILTRGKGTCWLLYNAREFMVVLKRRTISKSIAARSTSTSLRENYGNCVMILPLRLISDAPSK